MFKSWSYYIFLMPLEFDSAVRNQSVPLMFNPYLSFGNNALILKSHSVSLSCLLAQSHKGH